MSNLNKFRELMKEDNIDFYIIPSSDFHQSEYVSEYFKGREFISGFTGSVGTLLISQNQAYLWADGRYFIQAERELEGSGIELMKMATEGYPTLNEWLRKNCKENCKVAFDGRVLSTVLYKEILEIAKDNNFSIELNIDLLEKCWIERPSLPKESIFIHETIFSGKSSKEKIEEVRQNMEKKGAKSTIISSLDDIAWLLNIRGNDVKFNPVALSYCLVTIDYTNLYIDKNKVSKEIEDRLKSDGINIYPYEGIYKDVKELDGKVIIDENKLNAKVYNDINKNAKIINELNYTTKLKAIKNEVEIENIEKSQIRDGVAMVKFMKWLKENVGKVKITEISASDKLRSFRAEGENYKGDSFGTIAGYKDHAAMMHYSATEESDYELKKEGMLLIDSGAQYLDGTTDITRTFILGPITEEEKRDYTLVLKGHISLASAKFLKGTTGMNLDILARRPLWDYGMDYKCGTGHGVGFFLNVHEGPQGLRQVGNTTVFEKGMIVTNEPGVYKAGKHGIRTENTLLVVQDRKDEANGEFYSFKTVSYCPIDLEGIDIELLNKDEIKWLNNYHKEVYTKLSSYLNEEEKEFLRKETREVS